MTEVGFGLIGLGRISAAHRKGLRDAREHARLVAVCDSNRDLACAVAAEHGARAYFDYRDLLADGEVEAVDLPLPHNLHFEIAQAALEAGKHVLLEKPMAPTERQCAALIELAGERGVLVSVAENTRFVRAYIEAARLLRDGSLGAIRFVRTLIYGSSVARLSDLTSWKRSSPAPSAARSSMRRRILSIFCAGCSVTSLRCARSPTRSSPARKSKTTRSLRAA